MGRHRGIQQIQAWPAVLQSVSSSSSWLLVLLTNSGPRTPPGTRQAMAAHGFSTHLPGVPLWWLDLLASQVHMVCGPSDPLSPSPLPPHNCVRSNFYNKSPFPQVTGAQFPCSPRMRLLSTLCSRPFSLKQHFSKSGPWPRASPLLGACETCKFSGPTPDLLSQKFWRRVQQSVLTNPLGPSNTH